MVSNLELFLVISNSIIIGLLGFLYGKNFNTTPEKRRVHPDYLDEFGNTIIDTDEPDYNGVIMYDSDGDGDEDGVFFDR